MLSFLIFFSKNYLFAIFSGEDVEYAMKAYSDIVPAVFIPDTALFIVSIFKFIYTYVQII